MIDVVPNAGVIALGKQGENRAVRVTLPNIRAGAGSILLLHQRSDDQKPYPVPVVEADGGIIWTVSSTDTAYPGRGQAELQWLGADGAVVKSVTYQTNIVRALTTPGAVPDEPLKPYTQAVARDAQAAKDAAASATEAARSAGASATQAGLFADNAAKSLKKLEDGIASGEFHGQNGKSAYQLAVDAGFDGTETQWLESLKGAPGDTTAADAAAAAAKKSAGDAQKNATVAQAAAQEAQKAAEDCTGKVSELTEDFANLKEYVKGTNFPETWGQVVLAIKSKLHREMYAVGDKFSNVWKDTNNSNKEYDNPLRINHFENELELEGGTTVNGMWLQTVYAQLQGVQFSHQQAFYVSNEGMTAGTYCIGFDYTWGSGGHVNKGDYWNFTLTKDVPAGAKLAGFYGAPDQPQTNWKVYVYSADGKTVLETVTTVKSGQEGTLLGIMTAYGNDTLNGIQQMAYGDNRYATSAIRQYLNSDKPKGEWWAAQTKWDIAPDQLSQIDGYLCGMDPELLAVLQPVKVVTYCNAVTATGQKQVKDITYDKVTMISLEQMYIDPQIAGEGEAHEYYKELNGTSTKFKRLATYEILKTFAVENPTYPRGARLRSASRDSAFGAWFVGANGYVNNVNASNAYRPAPLMFIGAPTDAASTMERGK